jgi:sortase A
VVAQGSRGRRRGLQVAGAALICVGLALAGYVAWQFWGTTWVSERRQADIVASVEEQWARGADVAEVEEGRVGSIVRIPRFGDDFAVPLLEGTSDDVLAAGFGRFPDGADPGGRGNLALVGHRITHGEPLRRMPELRPGDEVVIETADGVDTYVLDTGGSDLRVSFSDSWVLDPVPENPQEGGVQPPSSAGDRLLTLTTCAELFSTHERLVAFGHLKSRVSRGAQTP